MSLANGQVETSEFLSKAEKLRANLAKVIRGKPEIIDYVLMALITDRSILIEDVPGVGKTTLARALAASLELEFRRVQCTPDLLPSDIFGVSVFNPMEGNFHFRPGPVFCNILLVDEINRASPRTQSALLEVMAERQVTVEGETYHIDSPFLVIATQNPFGFQGTFPLPESQLDRFLMKVTMDYPSRESELEILYQENEDKPLENLQPVLGLNDIIGLQQTLKQVAVERSLAGYLLSIVEQTRLDPRLELGCSPRGSISLFAAAKASAMLAGRSFVLPDDIQHVAPLVLSHRVAVRGRHHQGSSQQSVEIIHEIIQNIHVPV